METPSSTSSSEPARRRRGTFAAWPWALLIALLVGSLLEHGAYGSLELWRFFDARVEGPQALLEKGLIQDRIALATLDALPASDTAPRVFLVGSSRLNRAYRPDHHASGAQPVALIAKLAHPQFFPFEMRSAIGPILRRDPALVIFAVSELETFSRIKLMSGSSFGSWGAICDLIREAGLGFAFERRAILARIALGSIWNTVHYREVLQKAGLDAMIRFPMNQRLRPRHRAGTGSAVFLEGEMRGFTTPELIEIVNEFDSRFPGRGSIVQKAQFGIVRSITRGRHAKINLGLLRRSVSLLREAGVAVVIVEPPIYPGATILYDETIRDDFVRFARELERDHGVTFISLEEGPDYGPADFGDLTHLERSGAKKFTGSIEQAIARGLAGETHH